MLAGRDTTEKMEFTPLELYGSLLLFLFIFYQYNVNVLVIQKVLSEGFVKFNLWYFVSRSLETIKI